MKYIIKQYPDLLERVKRMCVEDLIRAVLCPNFNPQTKIPVKNTTSVFIHSGEEEKIRAVLQYLNEGREEPALAVSDMEYGAGKMIAGAVVFPSMRAVAEAGDEKLAYDMGVAAAKESLRIGYHWTFGPCVDILGNRRNPIVSIRTAGEDADAAVRYGGSYMMGLQDTGLIATLKHFPGDGYSYDDQHLTTTENPLSREEWDASFGRVYSELIEKGAKAIMPGHISLPSYDEIDPETGLYPPATLSKNLMTELLRKKLGFEGIIVSDATGMSGFCGYINFFRACARFLEAGGDCLLFAHESEELMDEMKKLIAEGYLKLETLQNRAYRMLSFVREYFETAPKPEAIAFDRKAAQDCADQITRKSMKLVRDRARLLPFKIDKDTRVAHIILSNIGTPDFSMKSVKDMTEKLKSVAGTVEEFYDPGPGKAKTIAKSGDFDLIICSVVNEMSYGLNVVRLSGPVARNMMQGWWRYNTPVIFVSYFDPYFADDFHAVTDTVINTYGYSHTTNDALLEMITGEKK